MPICSSYELKFLEYLLLLIWSTNIYLYTSNNDEPHFIENILCSCRRYSQIYINIVWYNFIITHNNKTSVHKAVTNMVHSSLLFNDTYLFTVESSSIYNLHYRFYTLWHSSVHHIHNQLFAYGVFHFPLAIAFIYTQEKYIYIYIYTLSCIMFLYPRKHKYIYKCTYYTVS